MDVKLLQGKCAVVTGGKQGIGREIARTYAENGADVAVIDINLDGAAELEQELSGLGVKAKCYACDVSDFGGVADIVKQIIEDFGQIHLLVNNAGITKDGLLVRMSEADFDKVIAVNLKGAFNFTRHVGAHMFRKKFGRIVSISSVVGIGGNVGQANYAASKAGVIGLTKTAAKELGARGVTVNAIAPGFVQTKMTEVLPEDVKTKMASAITLGRLGEPRDIANLALFLASDLSSYITGQVIPVDGGMTF
ncbi:MAG: 3-oxoacyl-[acyl-carrier-protein] reductase [Clostridiales bacterium]|nr:3-oxoacyl-[acyl-carrier-protein] reductase [Clostridiales bacterium]